MPRDRDESDINNLLGCPGADYENSDGEKLLADTLRAGFGLSAFTDDFIAALAAAHRAEDKRSGQRAEAAYRRSLRA